MSREGGTAFVFNKTKRTLLASRVKIADSMLSRLVGLLGKRRLEPGGGLWIFPSRGIHTLGMLFDIDVVFLDRDLKVVALRERIGPFSMTGLYLEAESALELPAHIIGKTRTEVGDELTISTSDPALSLESELPAETSIVGQ